MFGSGAWSLDSNATCGGLVSGCVGPRPVAVGGDDPQCSPGYYGDASDGGACVLCTGHSVGIVQRGGPVPRDLSGEVNIGPTSVAVSGSGAVLVLGFSDTSILGVELVGVVRVYSWSGVAWDQRGDDINGSAAGGGLGTVVAVSEDGNIVSASAPVGRAMRVKRLPLLLCSCGMGHCGRGGDRRLLVGGTGAISSAAAWR